MVFASDVRLRLAPSTSTVASRDSSTWQDNKGSLARTAFEYNLSYQDSACVASRRGEMKYWRSSRGEVKGKTERKRGRGGRGSAGVGG